MKLRCLLTVLVISVCCHPIPARAQTITAHPIARDVIADGKVLEMDIPAEIDGIRILVVFQNAYGEQRIVDMVARSGRHCYELRHLPEWRGPIQYVAPLYVTVQGRVKEPTVADEIDMFLAPERIMPTTINVVSQHTIFAWSWTNFLAISFVVTAAGFLLKKKQFVASVVLAFLVAWSLMDLRTVFDHAAIVYKKGKSRQTIPPFDHIAPFLDEASDVIGRSAWAHTEIDPLNQSFLRYRLAEHPYAVSGSGRTPALWIAHNAANGAVVLQHEDYYLLKKDKP